MTELETKLDLIRWAAATNSEQSIELLISFLNDTNTKVKINSIVELSYIGDDKLVIPELIKLFYDNDNNIRMWASSALTDKHKAVALPTLLDLSLNESEDVNARITAIWTLHEYPEELEVEIVLVYLANHPDLEIQYMAIESLGRLHSAHVQKILSLKTVSDNSDIREIAAIALEMIRIHYSA